MYMNMKTKHVSPFGIPIAVWRETRSLLWRQTKRFSVFHLLIMDITEFKAMLTDGGNSLSCVVLELPCLSLIRWELGRVLLINLPEKSQKFYTRILIGLLDIVIKYNSRIRSNLWNPSWTFVGQLPALRRTAWSPNWFSEARLLIAVI